MTRVSIRWSITTLKIIFKEDESKEEWAEKLNWEGSEAEQDIKEVTKAKAEDISAGSHYQVRAIKKLSL